jgi:catechol 2,3-dioxygenase-like lactoylglutathione lyase family enzyme
MDAVSLLLERGGRYDIFSAIAVGNLEAIRTLVEQQPDALDARLSSRHSGQPALHFAVTRDSLAVLDLILALGADIDATDQNGQTALEFALLSGKSRAANRLRAAGAEVPSRSNAEDVRQANTVLAASIQSATLVVASRDVAGTLSWYTSLGFTEVARYPEDGSATFWGLVRLGRAELSFDVRGGTDTHGAALLLATDRIQEFYRSLTSRQLGTADVEFVSTLHEPEHGGLEFSVRDPNGFILRFHQP